MGLPPDSWPSASWNVAQGLLAGRGMKITDVLQEPLIITDANLDQWLQPGWTMTTPIAYAPGQTDAYYPPELPRSVLREPGELRGRPVPW